MCDYLKDIPLSWVDEDVTLRRLMAKIIDSEAYKKYMLAVFGFIKLLGTKMSQINHKLQQAMVQLI